MGFGSKTDYQTGRVLDLDKTYRSIIEPAVKAAGLRCIRADDHVHAGIIDKPMYEFLRKADVVIADLSTSNANAIYELGVRHALRPHTTIVLAEKEFKFPFDLKSLLIRSYEHLGKGIDYEESMRAQSMLTAVIEELLARQAVDSPVHTFLPDLAASLNAICPSTSASAVELPASGEASAVLDQYRAARAANELVAARELAQQLCQRLPGDSYPIQQLALMTYKSKQPDERTALFEAHRVLQQLGPDSTLDPETLGLWGAVHKRLWELSQLPAYLDEAIDAYARGFFLRNDSYNGINYAFLLNVRAGRSDPQDAITDFTLAQRVRRRVVHLCERELKLQPRTEDGHSEREQRFWLRATLLEAKLGLGEDVAAAERQRLAFEAPDPWMSESMNRQLDNLSSLLADPPTRHLSR
jgi:hypothetical protein